MKPKIILLLLAITFNAEANFDVSTLEDIKALSNQSTISYEEGIQALLTLPDIFFARGFDHIKNPEAQEKQLQEWKTLYNEIHNRLFILTHIARIKHQISTEALSGHFRPARQKWQKQARRIKFQIKRDQLQALERILEIISAAYFDHSKHQFNSLSDLGKINTKELTDIEGPIIDTFSPNFSKSFSKSLSKGRYAFNSLSTSPTRTHPAPAITEDFLETLKAKIGEENAIAFQREMKRGNHREALAILRDPTRAKQEIREQRLRELRNYSLQFVYRYRSAQAFDMFYRENTSLPEEALPFLNRLGIEGPGPYSVQKDLSPFYRIAPPLQAKSNACVGFALAADIEFELQRTHKIRQNEVLSPYSVYATLRYQEDRIPSPDCLGLHSLSDTIVEGRWVMDMGIAQLDFTNINFCLTSSSRDTTNHTGYVSIKDMEIYEGEVTFALLKAMIDHRKPPILLISSDAREEVEDWINITNKGHFEHTFVVVGYGTEDIDPFTLSKGPYFLVRDSLTSRPITYKISPKNLLSHSLAVLKTSQLERY